MAPTTVTFDGVDATDVTVTSATELTATVPAGAAGTVDVVVSTTAGDANPLQYEYVDAPEDPTITAISPMSALMAGFDTVFTLTGTGLDQIQPGPVPAVGEVYVAWTYNTAQIGNASTSVTVVSETQVTVTAQSLGGSGGDVYCQIIRYMGPGNPSTIVFTFEDPVNFYYPDVTLTDVNPSEIVAGVTTSVTLTGTALDTDGNRFFIFPAGGFSPVPDGMVATGTPTDTEATFDITVPDAGDYEIRIGWSDGHTLATAPMTVTEP